MQEKSSLSKSKSSNFNYFIIDEHEAFGNDVYYHIFPIKDTKPLGNILLAILNNKETLYNSFSSFMNDIKLSNSIDEIKSKIPEYYNKYWKDEILTPIPNKLTYESIKLDNINDLIKKIDIYFSDIKSIIENFCDYCIGSNQELKQYISWNMKIPESYFMFGVEDPEDYCIYLQRPIELERFKKTNRIAELMPIKKYIITDFIDLLNVNIDIFFTKKIHINKCKNCGKYFIPSNRSDEKYCDNPSPQKPKKTCKQYGAKKSYLDSITSIPIKEEHNRTSQYFRVKICRAKKKDDISTVSTFGTKLDKYLANYQKQLKKYEKHKISEEEFIDWIISQKEI